MSSTPFMPLWVSDFLGDTLDLDATEIGAYMLLLMAQWNRDGESLPDDAKKLQRVARCGRNWATVWGSIERFFEKDAKGIYNKRLRLEAQNVATKREVNARNGARGGKAKALKTNNADLANATNSPKRKASIPEPEPYKKEDTIVSFKKRKKPSVSLADDWVPCLDLSAKLKADHSLTRDEMNFCYQQMKGHAHANDRKCVNWNAAFGNWIRKAVADGQIGPSSRGRKLNDDQGEKWRSTFD